ncbi:MAG: hypothetical protein RML12_00680 [Xanthomonadales bacterium]|nr:hypothetical protein [Xanthomonadales bacterium]
MRREAFFPAFFLVFFGVLWAPAALALPARHGDRHVGSGEVVLNQYARLAADAAPGDLQIEVTDIAELASPEPVGGGPLAAGDLVLLYQARGAELRTVHGELYGIVTDRGGAGSYELRTVARVQGNRIELEPVFEAGSCLGLRQPFRAAHSQVIRVPSYRRLSVAAGAAVVARPWDGERGGVAALVARELVLDGAISASGRGFRGGPAEGNDRPPGGPTPIAYASDAVPAGGHKGEGVGSLGAHVYQGQSFPFSNPGGNFDEAPAGNGGGGGGSHGAGGGGGAHVDIDLPWTPHAAVAYDPRLPAILFARQGNPDLASPAWALDPVSQVPNGFGHPGGGRGGYSAATADLDALSVGPSQAAWGGDWRRPKGGWGGHGIYWIGSSYSGVAFFGGGGGAGASAEGRAGGGGRGGGVVLVEVGRLLGSGRFEAEGARGEDATGGASGAGGGGGGGSLILYLRDLQDFTGSFRARGGRGGDQRPSGPGSAGPGGGGGGGVVFISTQSLPASLDLSVEGGPSGVSLAQAVSEFPENGATPGNFGLSAAATPYRPLLTPDCDRLRFDKRVTAGEPFTAPGQTLSYELRAENAGERPITVSAIADPLLPGLSCTPALPASLAPGAAVVCTGSYLTTAADVAAGLVRNRARLSGLRQGGAEYGPLEAETLARAAPAGAPAMTLVKTATLEDANGSGRGEPGELVRYRIELRNTGTLPLTGATIGDPLLPSLACTPPQPAALAPGATLVCEGQRPIAASDLQSGAVLRNTARGEARAGAELLAREASAEVPLGSPPPRPIPFLGLGGLALLGLLTLALAGRHPRGPAARRARGE